MKNTFLKSIVNCAILLSLFPSTSSGLPDYYGDLDAQTWWKCEKDTYISRVWGLERIRKEQLLFVVSAPWTSAGTWTCKAYEWDGKLPLNDDPFDPKHNIRPLYTNKAACWFYETTGPLSRWQGCPYKEFSKWVANDRRYWTFVGDDFSVWQ